MTEHTAPRLTVTAAPHVHGKMTVPHLMLWTMAALVPAATIAVVMVGLPALYSILLSVAAAIVSEWLFQVIGRRKAVLPDGSAGVTGLLVALSLPAGLPVWAAPAGSLFAIALVKMAFGGLGRNFLNPAMAGRAFLVVAFPVLFSQTALAKTQPSIQGLDTSGLADLLFNLLTGYHSGWTGSFSFGAILLGAVLLISLRIIDFRVPLAFFGMAVILAWLVETNGPLFSHTAILASLCSVMSGGVPFAAVFCATDPVTSPATRNARLLFGAGCGALAFVFHRFGAVDSGPMLAILLLNLTVPYLDRYLRPGIFSKRTGLKGKQP